MGRNRVIMIGGVPGTGKSTIALEIGKIIGCDQVVSTDLVRGVLRSFSGKENNPLLFSTTHEAWKHLGRKNNLTLIQGMKAQSRLLYKTISYLIKMSEDEGRDIILEGVHLIPELGDYLKTNLDVHYFLLHVEKKEEHLKRFDIKNSKRTVFHHKWYSNFGEISILNEWLKLECRKRGLKIIENSNMALTVREILERLGLQNQIWGRNEILYA